MDATGWDAAAWDDLAVRGAGGDVFQSHAWGELKRELGWVPQRRVVEDAGGPVAAVAWQERSVARALSAIAALPAPLRAGLGRGGLEHGTALGRLAAPALGLRFLYAPRGPVLLRPGPEAAAVALRALRTIARGRRAVVLTIDPAWDEGGPLAAELAAAGFRPALREVQVSRTAMPVPLLPDEGEQHRLLGDSTARNVNKARRAGVLVERVDLSDPGSREAALEEFHAFFADTARGEGFVLRDRAYLLRQWRALGEARLASLWFSRLGERRLNGVIVLHSGEQLVSYQAGAPDGADLRRTRANHLLQWEIMRWGAARGYRLYDLGGVDTQDAPGLPADRTHPLWNLYEFKQGFGARGVVRVRAHEYAPRPALGLAWRTWQRAGV